MYLHWHLGLAFVCLSRLPEGGTLHKFYFMICILLYCIV